MIPFVDLQAQYRSIKTEIDNAVLSVLDSGHYVLGDEVEALEKEFARYCGTADAIAVNSGTSALHLTLLASGIGPGDEVITTPLTFVATVAAIVYTGARAVLADIDPVSLNIDAREIERAITPRTTAIVPVHLYGQPADMTEICDLARSNGISVIEDAAQSHGATHSGRGTGSIGNAGAFSFYPTKNLGAFGEGGMITTSDADLAQKARALRSWGQKERGTHGLKGYNYRMDAIQGAILRVKLAHLDEWNRLRRERAGWYDSLLDDSAVEIPRAETDRCHVYHLYVIRAQNRDALRESLAQKGIETAIHYRLPVHLEEAYSDLGYGPGDFPHAERAANAVLSLPLSPELTQDQITTVANAVRDS